MSREQTEGSERAEGRVEGATVGSAVGSAAGSAVGSNVGSVKGLAAEPAAGVVCPGCGASGASVRTVADACADPESRSSGLADRLAKAPGVSSRSDSFTHFLEGVILAGLGAGLAYSGVQNDKPLYTIGGTLLAVLLVVGTLFVIRGESRERATVGVGKPRAEDLWSPAHYCASCGSVFYPTGSPWPGPLTTDQFRKYVWTEAGFGKQIEERLRNVELPPRTPTGPKDPTGAAGPEGTPDHV